MFFWPWHKRTNAFNFFRTTLPSVEGIILLNFINPDAFCFSLADMKTDGKAGPSIGVPAQISHEMQATVTEKTQKTGHMVSHCIFSFLYFF